MPTLDDSSGTILGGQIMPTYSKPVLLAETNLTQTVSNEAQKAAPAGVLVVATPGKEAKGSLCR